MEGFAIKSSLHLGLNEVWLTSYGGWNGWLRNPVNDARDTAAFYARAGFVSRAVFNLEASKERLRLELYAASQTHVAGDTFLFYYSGHGGRAGSWTLSGYTETLCLADGEIADTALREMFAQFAPGVRVVFISDSCLVGSTKIPLLDGTEPTIKELAEHGGKFWVYSAKPDGQIVPGLAHSARITKRAETVRVTLDNDQFVECTGDHLFMLRDGSYMHAEDLKSGDSLMPLYRRIGTAADNYLKGYELVYDLRGRGRWWPTHIVVAKYCGIRPEKCSGYVVHHKNFNKRDNQPENFQLVTWDAHKKMHGEVGRRNLLKTWSDPEFRAWRKSKEYRDAQAERTRKTWGDPEHHAKRSSINRETHLRDGFSEKFTAYNFSKENSKSTISRNSPGGDIYEAIHKRMRMEMEDRAKLDSDDLPFSDWNVKLFNNHKVVSVEKTHVVEDVYDLTVDDHHNFALSSGVFVHNCHAGGLSRTRPPSRDKPAHVKSSVTLPADREIPVAASMMLIAASQDYELSSDGEGNNGAFTAALLQVGDDFEAQSKPLTWDAHVEAIQRYMAKDFPTQHPVVERYGAVADWNIEVAS